MKSGGLELGSRGISHGSVLNGTLHEGAGLGVTANLTGAEDIIAHHDGLGKEGRRGGGIGGFDGGLGERHFEVVVVVVVVVGLMLEMMKKMELKSRRPL